MGYGSVASLSADPLRLIAFGLEGEWYALEVSYVRGIETEIEITPVPCAPEWLVGVFNLHGAILPAIDPRSLLGVARQEPKSSGPLIVVQWDGNLAALRADAVDEMYEVSRASLEPQIAISEGSRAELILGQVRVRDRLIGVLHLPALVKALIEG